MALQDENQTPFEDIDTRDLDTQDVDTRDVEPGDFALADDQEEELPKTRDHRVKVMSEHNVDRAINVSADPDAPAKRPPRKRWYIVHTYSGHENKVKVNLERRIESMNMGDKIFRVEVPQKSVTKIKDGKRTEKEERIFPGYVLVEMLMDDDSWYVVRHTPGVTKFVGSQKKPIPAKDSEIKRILLRSQPVAAKIEIDLKVGEVVKITSGPFADFEGTVTEVSPEKERLKASVSIFGRETPVELAFNQVQKSH
jgi:transcriptional antiterminator NusG